MAKYLRGVGPAGLGLASLVAFASPVGAGEADRSLEETYARDCPNNKKSQLCDTLRGAIRSAGTATADRAKATEAPAVDARWGVLAGFAERDYHGPNDQTVTFRWEVPGETMAVIFWSPLVSPTYRFRLDRISGQMELESPGQWKRQRTSVRMTESGDLHLEGLPYSKPYVSRGINGNPIFLGAELTPATPGSRAAKKVANLVAAGKVRAPAPIATTVANPATVADEGSSSTLSAAAPQPLAGQQAAASGPASVGMVLHAHTKKELGKLVDPTQPPAVVEYTIPTMPARDAGLLPRDVVTTVNGTPVTVLDFAETISRLPVGTPASFGILRKGAASTISVTPVARIDEEAARQLARLDRKLPREAWAPLLHLDRLISTETTTDDRGHNLIWREACFKIEAPRGSAVRLDVAAYGQVGILTTRYDCDGLTYAGATASNFGHRPDFSAVTEIGDKVQYATVSFRGAGKKYELKATLLSPAEVAAWREERRLAEIARQQAEASSGNSGLFGALAMATGAALAGGNAEMVMGAAMKGAELSTDNEMTRNVLAGQGDQMIMEGVERRAAEVASHNARIAAEQAAARQAAEEQRAEQERLATAENARRVAEANARQEAIAQEYAQKRATGEAQASAAKAQADADRERRAEDQRRAAEETARREAEARQQAAELERQKREAHAEAEAERRRQAEAARLTEVRRREEEARRPVAFKEGVVVCEKKRENYYRCDGPLQVTYSDLVSPAGLTSIGQACGARTTRDLGMSGGYRIFGCGFGIHPTNRDYPGNRDTPAMYGLYISDRATFYCPKTIDAYCRGR